MKRHKNQLLFHFAAAILILTGCAPEIQKLTRICPGKESVADVISVLRSRTQNVVPLKANGQCYLEFYEDGKPRKENFWVKIWLNPVRSSSQEGTDVRPLTSNGVNPPAEIYLQGDVTFDPRGIVLGSNENEFWLAIRLKEISSYWYGRWKETSHIDELIISPRLVLEAFGIAEVGRDDENWSLSKEEAFDVLIRRDGKGGIIKKIYIYNCDCSVRKIEYFDVNGQAKVIVELGKYKQVLDEFFVPRIIKIVNSGESEKDLTSVTVNLTSIRSADFSLKQRNLLFMPPKQNGYKHVFEYIDGKLIEKR